MISVSLLMASASSCVHRYLDLLESVSHESAVTAKAQIVYEKKKLEDMVQPTMMPSAQLDEIVKPQARWGQSHCSMYQIGHVGKFCMALDVTVAVTAMCCTSVLHFHVIYACDLLVSLAWVHACTSTC